MRRPPASTLASGAAAAGVLAATAWHIARNAAPPSFDDAWYLETSFRLWTALKSGPLPFLDAYENAFRIKAPLISLMPNDLLGPTLRIPRRRDKCRKTASLPEQRSNCACPANLN